LVNKTVTTSSKPFLDAFLLHVEIYSQMSGIYSLEAAFSRLDEKRFYRKLDDFKLNTKNPYTLS